MDIRGMPVEEDVHASCHPKEIPIQGTSVYLGMPIGFNKEECSLLGGLVLESMRDHILALGNPNLNIAQKLEGVKFMELARIDYRMMCATLTAADLDKFDRWLRGQVQSWLHMHGIPQGLAGMSWRDGGFTLPSLHERQNTMIIRTICDIMTSNDPQIRKMMEIFEEEQAGVYGMHIEERVNQDDDRRFLRWAGTNPDWNDYPVSRLHSIFSRAFKAVQESDISVNIKDGKPHLSHEQAENFTVSKFSRPAMWITQNVMRRNDAKAFNMKVQASKGWWDL
jgi:hypothetical protein